MNQAQGAIDAARAAGAEQYAPEELAGAVAALRQAQESVSQRDNRTALSQAIDSREQAQNAARQAAEARALVQSQAERSLTELRLLLERGDERVAQAEARGLPRTTVMTARGALASAVNALQEASAAMSRGDYAAVRRRIDAVQGDAAAAVAEVERLLDGA